MSGSISGMEPAEEEADASIPVLCGFVRCFQGVLEPGRGAERAKTGSRKSASDFTVHKCEKFAKTRAKL